MFSTCNDARRFFPDIFEAAQIEVSIDMRHISILHMVHKVNLLVSIHLLP